MKKFNTFLLAGAAIFASLQTNAQRYLTPQFSSVTVNPNVVYGTNYTVLTVPVTGRTGRQPLTCDVYRATTDVETKRPLVIYLHTGNFLPNTITGSAMGTKEDSTNIEICHRLAKLGYVAVSATYRIGWNPTASAQEDRVSTLINAAYRGVQDARTCIRFFKANAATYGIDTNKIVLWGQGTGGYISLAAATLDDYSETITAKFPAGKFLDQRTNPPTPMVIQALPTNPPTFVSGDIEGKVLGRVPAGTTPPVGDTLCFPNHVANTSNFNMQVNLGGALGDLSWLNNGGAVQPAIPMISFQAPYDRFAPYTSSVLLVPTGPSTALPVVEVQGAGTYQYTADTLGLNNVFNNILPQYNPYKAIFDARNTAASGRVMRGCFPMLGDTVTDSSPWDFWAPNHPNAANSLAGSPRTTPARAKRYIDTIMTIFAPRACVALNLPCKGVVTSTEELLNVNAYKVTAAPVPALDAVRFESEETNPIRGVQVFDLSGRMVREIRELNTSQYQLQRQGLPSGVYFTKLKFEGGIITKKIIFE